MSVTITPEVTVNASLASKACESATQFSRDFNRRAEDAAEKAANDSGADPYSYRWYDAYNAVYRPMLEGRSEYIDTQMVLAGLAGWTMVGSGAFRVAMLGPDGLIYKVGDTCDNQTEARISAKLHSDTKCPKAFRILDMKIVGEILVTEYAPKHPEQPNRDHHSHPEWGTFRRWVESHGHSVLDTHGQNIWWDGESWVVIDMGNWTG